MIEPVGDERDRRLPISPQLAMRVAVLGFVAFAVFGVIFFRLWYLQVLSGDQYLAQARNNQVRTMRIPAPRGAIVDRQGRVLVENRVSTIVQLDPEQLPQAERDQAAAWGQLMTQRARRPKGEKGPVPPMPPPATQRLRRQFVRLGHVLGMSPRAVQERVVTSLVLASYARITVKAAVPDTVRDYLLERKRYFPGVTVEKTYLRRYPHGSTAAQILGTIGEISRQEMKLKRFKGVPQGTIVGKEGLEYAYDRYLRGVDGKTQIIVDALGRPKGQREALRPEPGRSIRLSLDLDLQQSGQQALARSIATTPGVAGAFVAMDPTDGRILAMGSNPSYDPSVLSRPITQQRYEQLFGEQAGSPRFNRAIGGFYATGSTFKPITALAGLTSGIITPGTTINDNACVQIGEQERCNAGKASYGAVDLRRALQVSSDVYFYLLGQALNPLKGQPLQRWARRLGLGRLTGIDLPAEGRGTIPDRAWRAGRARVEGRCRRKRHIPLSANVYVAAARGCGISDMRPWSMGDNVNLAIGQGDIQASPLQMATAYSAIMTGGKVPRPHLGTEVEDANGRVLQDIEHPRGRRAAIPPDALAPVRDGLHLATIGPGTSGFVFKGWNQSRFPVYGKTGTAQTSKGDQAWYVCYVPDPARPIAIAVTVEQGGFGSEAAAPVARWMLGQWFGQKKVWSGAALGKVE
ncbi:MAG TPA: penicillin-binding transpeptidase domain-containing protein [Solirubrobacteraceae bacterium]|nr:penicillin-binding transpeptidase domain-containing protein [Solirubrobacteraceae bacterium]